MNREILFRGKRIDNREWVEGNYFKRWTGASYKHYIHDGLYDIEVIHETVGQYTGLLDKNGKKIFEHDMVRYQEAHGMDCDEEPEKAMRIDEHLGTVYYLNGSFHPIPKRDDVDDYYYSCAYFDFEVVGNIHDKENTAE